MKYLQGIPDKLDRWDTIAPWAPSLNQSRTRGSFTLISLKMDGSRNCNVVDKCSFEARNPGFKSEVCLPWWLSGKESTCQ